jgi:hypothetical protein
MNYNLLIDNNLNLYGILISSGFILGCSIYYLIKSNYTAIPSQNIETITNEDIEGIINENVVTIVTNDNIEAIIDSESDTDYASDYQSTFDSDSSLEIDITDLNLFFMPNVDLNVCSIQELKVYEWTSIFAKELEENFVTEEELMDAVWIIPEELLFTNEINDLILQAILDI